MPLPPRQLPGPVFAKVEYSSIYAPHVAIIPLRDEWVDTGTSLGSITPWDGGSDITVISMFEDYMNAWAELLNDTSSFNGITIYTQPDPDVPAQPQASVAVSVPGLLTDAPGDLATQVTLSFRDTEFFLARLTMLDIPVGSDFTKKTPFTVVADIQAVINVFISEDNAFASRHGFRPSQFIAQTTTVNDSLRRAYRLT